VKYLFIKFQNLIKHMCYIITGIICNIPGAKNLIPYTIEFTENFHKIPTGNVIKLRKEDTFNLPKSSASWRKPDDTHAKGQSSSRRAMSLS